MFKLCPSGCPVNGTCLVDVFRHGLQTRDVYNGIHGNRLPGTYDHNTEPGPFLTGQNTGSLPAHHIDQRRYNICKEIVKDIANYQCAQNVRHKIQAS